MGNFTVEGGGLFRGDYGGYALSARATSATLIPLMARGAASQTANLTEWQDSTGAVKAFIASTGGLVIGSDTSNFTLISGTSGQGIFRLQNSGSVGLTVKGFSGQTADLQQWQNSAGTAIAKVDSSGNLTANYLISSAAARFNTGSAATISVVVKGATSQTANLTEWQDSSANVLAQVSSAGSFRSAGSGAFGSVTAGLIGTLNVYSRAAGEIVVGVRGTTSQTANLQEWQQSDGTVVASIANSGLVRANIFASTTGGTTGLYPNWDTNGWAFIAGGAAQKGVVVRGAASQSANLQEWQDSTPTTLASVSPSGIGTFRYVSAGFGSTFSARLAVDVGSASTIGAVIRGAASQTANLLELQDSAGTILARVASNGNPYVQAVLPISTATTGAYLALDSNIAQIIQRTAGATAFTVKGAASQTGDLTQWLNSSNTPLVTVSGAGFFTAYQGAQLTAGNSSMVAAIIKGAASQSSDLMQIANSSGTILRKVTAGGQEYLTATTLSGVDTQAEAANFNSSYLPNEVWSDKVRFRQGTYETSVDGSTGWTAGTFGSDIVDGRQDTSMTLSTATLGHRWTWQAGDLSWSSACIARISTGYISPTTTYDLTIESSADGTTWTSRGAFTACVGYIGRRIFVFNEWGADSYARVTIKHNSAANSIRLEAIELLSYRPGDQGGAVQGIEGNLPFAWTGNKTVVFQPSLPSSNGLVVRGAASQTADFLQIQNSSATRQVYIDQYYQIVTPSTVYANNVSNNNSRWGFTNNGTGYVTASAPTYTPLILKGAASQTANLQEWQDSAGTAITNVTSSGGVSVNYANATAAGTSGIGALEVKRTLFVDTGLNTTVGIIVRGRASQSANLTEWQDSAASVVARVTSAGYILAPGFRDLATTGAYIDMQPAGAVLVQTRSTTNVGLVVKAVASQSANLQEWQDSSGTIVARVNSVGTYFTQSGGSYIANNGQAFFGADTAARVPLTAKGAPSQTANLTEWQDSAGGVKARVSSTGTFANTGGTTLASNAEINAYGAAVLVSSGVSTYPMIIAKGAASHTANLQEWQNSAGTVQARINAAGSFTTTGVIIAGASSGSFAALNAISSDVAQIPLGVKGFSGQTANLTEWQDSAGTVLSKVSPSGVVMAGNGIVSGGLNTGPGVATFFAGAAGNIPLAVRGATSQTASLTEWQSDTGTVLSRIRNDGAFITNQPVYIATGNGLRDSAGTGAYLNMQSADGILVNTRAAANKGLIVQGAASQTASLQEWQLSGGQVPVFVDYAGQLRTGYYYTSFGGGAVGLGLVTINPTGNIVPLAIRGTASQTANLQEWQDSAGVVKANVNSGGVISSGNGFRSAYFASGANTGTLIDMAQNAGSMTVVSRDNVANVTLITKAMASQTADIQQWQNSAGTVLGKVDANGAFYAAAVSTNGVYAYLADLNSGGFLQITRQTAAASNPGANKARLYFRDGTTAGTLKLTIRAGASGVETPIIDNIDQTGTDTSVLAVKYIDGGTA